MTPREILEKTEAALVIDWPTRDVPEALARAGVRVFVRGGPGPEDFSVYEASDGTVAARHIGRPPERVDLVYAYRPLRELPGIVAAARSLHARTVWTQSGLSATGAKDASGCWLPAAELQSARKIVESAGLKHISGPCIADVAREIMAGI